MTQRVPYRSGVVRRKSPIPTPNFNKPPVASFSKKAKPKVKVKTRAKVGPYTKPVKYQAGKKYRVGQPVQLDNGQVVINQRTTPTPKRAKIPGRASSIKSGVSAQRLASTPMFSHDDQGKTYVTPSGKIDKKGKFHANPAPPIADISAATLGLGGFLDRASRTFVGPSITNAVEGKPFDPLWAPIEAAGILPFGRALRFAKLIKPVHEALQEGKSVEEATAIARAHVSRLPPDRFINAGGREIRVPAAPQAHIRGVQKALDKNIESVITRGAERGLSPHEALAEGGLRPRMARKRVSRLVESTGFTERQAAHAAPKALANTNLKPAQLIALRQMARNIHPNIEIQSNNRLIAAAGAAGHTDRVAALRRENTLLQASRHYIEGQGNRVFLRTGEDKATKQVRDTWDALKREGASAEQIQISLGELDPQQAALRKNQPGELTLANIGYRSAGDVEPYISSKGAQEGIGSIPDRATQPGYVYHRAPAASFSQIKEKGLLPLSRAAGKKFLYLADNPLWGEGLSWKYGGSIYLRAKRDNVGNLIEKYRGEFFTPRGIPSKDLEYLGKDGTWHPINGYEAGYAEHQGNLYYKSRYSGNKNVPGQRGWSPAGFIKPFRPAKESKQAFKGVVQQSGLEDPNLPKIVGQTKLRRINTMLAIDQMKELRANSIKGALPQTGNLDKDFRALPLFDNPGSESRARLLNLVENLSSKAEITDAEASQFGEALKKVRDELSQYPSQLVKEGQLPKEYGLVHKSFMAAIEDPKLYNARNISNFHRIMMDVSTVAKDMVVYTKLGHAPPRYISNMLMVTPDAGKDFLPAFWALRKLHKSDPQLTDWIHEMMGGGYFKSYTETSSLPHKAIQNLSKGLVGWIEKVADRDPRNIAFLAFAIKDSGTKDIRQLETYLKNLRDANPGTEAWASRNRILLHSRQAAGEYERVGGDSSIGNFIFLYRWLKTSTVWTSRFVVKHPVMASALGYGTYQYGYHPDQPIWNRFNVAGHNIQTALPWSTPVEIGERAKSLGQSGKIGLGEGLLDMVNPAISTVVGMAAHKDLETGAEYKGNPEIAALQKFGKQTPIGALVAGKKSIQDRIIKFIFGNYAPTEYYTQVDKAQQNLIDKAVSAGILKKGQKLPQVIIDELQIAHIRRERGAKGIKDEVKLLQKEKKLTDRQAEGLLKNKNLTPEAQKLVHGALSQLLLTPNLDAYLSVIAEQNG